VAGRQVLPTLEPGGKERAQSWSQDGSDHKDSSIWEQEAVAVEGPYLPRRYITLGHNTRDARLVARKGRTPQCDRRRSRAVSEISISLQEKRKRRSGSPGQQIPGREKQHKMTCSDTMRRLSEGVPPLGLTQRTLQGEEYMTSEGFTPQYFIKMFYCADMTVHREKSSGARPIPHPLEPSLCAGPPYRLSLHSIYV